MDSRGLALVLFLVGLVVAPPPGPAIQNGPAYKGPKPHEDKPRLAGPGADVESESESEEPSEWAVELPYEEEEYSSQQQEQQKPTFGHSAEGQKQGYKNKPSFQGQGFYKPQGGFNEQMSAGYQTPAFPQSQAFDQHQQFVPQQVQAYLQQQQQQQQQQGYKLPQASQMWQDQPSFNFPNMPQGLGMYSHVPMMINPHDFTPFSNGFGGLPMSVGGYGMPQMFNTPSFQQGQGYGVPQQGEVQGQMQFTPPSVQAKFYNPNQASRKKTAKPKKNKKPTPQQAQVQATPEAAVPEAAVPEAAVPLY